MTDGQIQNTIARLQGIRDTLRSVPVPISERNLNEAIRELEASSVAAKEPQDRPSCRGCGGPHPFDTTVPSVRWNAVIRKAGLPDYLCLTCIVTAFVTAGESFTAELVGGEHHFEPIEIRTRSQNATDAQAISRENTELRARIRELEGALSAPAPLQGDHIRRIADHILHDHMPADAFTDAAERLARHVLAEVSSPAPPQPEAIVTGGLKCRDGEHVYSKYSLVRCQCGEMTTGETYIDTTVAAAPAPSCSFCGNPLHAGSCPSPPGKHESVSLRAAPPALEELIEAWRAKRNLTDRPRWTVYERCADELETALADVARLQTPHEDRTK